MAYGLVGKPIWSKHLDNPEPFWTQIDFRQHGFDVQNPYSCILAHEVPTFWHLFVAPVIWFVISWFLKSNHGSQNKRRQIKSNHDLILPSPGLLCFETFKCFENPLPTHLGAPKIHNTNSKSLSGLRGFENQNNGEHQNITSCSRNLRRISIWRWNPPYNNYLETV